MDVTVKKKKNKGPPSKNTSNASISMNWTQQEQAIILLNSSYIAKGHQIYNSNIFKKTFYRAKQNWIQFV